jgi:hypothetical protein
MRGRSAGLVSALVALAVALAADPTVAQTAVPLWRQTFRPSTSGTISPAPLASRELVDGTVMVVTDDGSVVRYDHDGNVVSSTQLPLGRPVPKSQPSRAGRPDAPDGGGQHPPVAAIDAFGTVAFSRQILLGFQGSDSNIVTMKFDGITAEPLWQAPAVWDANGQNYPLSVLFDSNGNVVMSGVNMASIHVLVEYSASTGETRWGPKLLANVSPPYVKTVIGPYDSVIVSATWGGSGGPDLDILTTAYAALNGITLWSEDFDSGKDDVVADATLDSFGRVILAGYTGDLTGLRYLVLSYEALGGGLHWQSQPYAGPAGSFSVATSVRADLFNNLFVSGSSSSPGGSPIQYATLKLDGITGQPIWGPQIRDNANSAGAPDLLLTGNGDVIVDALVDDGTLARDFIRYRGSDGEPVSEAPIPSADPAAQIPDAPLVASNGRIFDAAAFASQTVVLEIEGTSAAWGPTPITEAAVGQGQFNDLFVDGNGDVLALGDRADHTETLVLKYDGHTGAVLWGPISIANAAGMYSYQIVADAANDAFVVANDGNGALELFKLSGANGSQIWSLAYPLPDTYLSPARAAVDTAGHLVVVAQSNDVNGTASAVTLKIDGATNAVLWSKTYQADVNVQAFANTVAIALSGDVFLVGDTYSTQISQYDWFAIKYAAATGDVVWGPIVFPNGQPFGAASDPSGNLVMTGSRPNGMTTNKYSGADGSFLWSTSVSGVSIAEGRDVIVNASGDVYAAGNIGRETSVVDMAIVKYASADGSVLWGPRYFDGEAHSWDIVYDLGLGLDGSGNVVLGGTTRRPSNYTDLVALKYDAGTGATLWGPVYAGGPGDQTMTGFGVHGGLVAAGAPSAGAFLIQAWSDAFGIATPLGSLPPAYCGIELSFTFSAANGTTPYAWSISAGALPAGMTLSSTGILSGTPTEQGLFTFTVHVSDASAASASRDFTLFVQPPPDRAIITSATDSTCQTTLSVLGNDWAALQWLPGGETTPTIVVRPTTATTYGVLATDAEGCVHRGELTVPGYPLVNPECDAPSISSVSPPSGSAAGGVSLTIAGANFDPAAVVHVGGVEATVVSADSGQIVVTTPVLTPGTANDVLVLNPSSANAAMLKAFFADFLDVPDSDPFHDDIALLVKNGITAGCGSGNYCPAASVTRAQMAVFLLKSKYGASHVPPPATGVFNDVPAEDPFAPWIEELASLGVTAGCGNDNYCPAAPVTRAQMAVFLLKTLNGSSYTPPPATGIFGDVPASDPFAPWIEQLYLLQITGGCSTSPLLYCPASSVTRAQMSAFLSRTFALS